VVTSDYDRLMGSSVGLEFGKEAAECSYLCKSFRRLVSPKKANLDVDIVGQKEAAVLSKIPSLPISFGEVIGDGWRQLFKSYPDRVLTRPAGQSSKHPQSMAKEIGEFFRTTLAQLTSTTARKIAYENAEKV
jgi:hypothetical protein